MEVCLDKPRELGRPEVDVMRDTPSKPVVDVCRDIAEEEDNTAINLFYLFSCSIILTVWLRFYIKLRFINLLHNVLFFFF